VLALHGAGELRLLGGDGQPPSFAIERPILSALEV